MILTFSQYIDLINQFEFSDHLATETTERDINEFYPQDQTKNSKAFIRFQNFNELFQFVLMNITTLILPPCHKL